MAFSPIKIQPIFPHLKVHRMFRRITLQALLAVATLGLSACATPPANVADSVASNKSPSSMLWVGNSFFYYNNSMHGHVGLLLNAAGTKGVRQTSATISGSGMNWHDMSAHFKPGGVASYSFVGDNEVQFNNFDKPFDAVLMMDCSQCPIHPKLQSVFYDTVQKQVAIARKNGAEPMLFMSWAYQDKPEMTEQLAAEYVKAGKQNGVKVVPAGYAFANSIKVRPDLNLYVADKRHPSVAGTYLGACVVLASVFKVNPIGSSYTAGLPADIAKHLQTIAWETVQKF
jgi:hypothetical protein